MAAANADPTRTGPLRAVALMLGSSVVSILVSVARQKSVALVLGAAGVGQLGLLTASQGVGVAAFGFGTQQSSVRELAAPPDLTIAWTAATLVSSLLALLGGLVVLTLAASGVWGNAGSPMEVASLAATVALSVHSQAPMSFLNARQRLRDLARITATGASVGTAAALLTLWIVPSVALPSLLLAPVATTWGLAWWEVRGEARTSFALPDVRKAVRPIVTLGAAVFVTALLPALGQWALRELFLDRLGVGAVGLLHASLAISSLYLGFLLNALGAEYYPRLVKVVREPAVLVETINGQLSLILVVATPVVMVGILLAPIGLELLFSHEFAPASLSLRLQLWGDVPKLASWPLAYVLMATNRRRAMIGVEGLWVVACLGVTAALITPLGIAAAGMGYASAYWVYLACLIWLTYKQTAWRPTRLVVREFAFAVLASALSLAACQLGFWAMGMVAMIAMTLMVRALREVGRLWRRERAAA